MVVFISLPSLNPDSFNLSDMAEVYAKKFIILLYDTITRIEINPKKRVCNSFWKSIFIKKQYER